MVFARFARETSIHTRQMVYTQDTTPNPDRIDPDHYEQSPSCDTFTLAEVMGCPNAHAADAGADRTDMDRLAAATREDRPSEYRKKHALEVSS